MRNYYRWGAFWQLCSNRSGAFIAGSRLSGWRVVGWECGSGLPIQGCRFLGPGNMQCECWCETAIVEFKFSSVRRLEALMVKGRVWRLSSQHGIYFLGGASLPRVDMKHCNVVESVHIFPAAWNIAHWKPCRRTWWRFGEVSKEISRCPRSGNAWGVTFALKWLSSAGLESAQHRRLNAGFACFPPTMWPPDYLSWIPKCQCFFISELPMI